MNRQNLLKGIFISCFLFLFSCSGAQPGGSESLSPQEFKSSLGKKNVMLVDVRTPEEYNDGHLANAMLINYEDTSFQSTVLSKVPKDAEVLLYCHSGRRSAGAKNMMKQMGYKNVAHLDGGIKAWQAQNFPVEK